MIFDSHFGRDKLAPSWRIPLIFAILLLTSCGTDAQNGAGGSGGSGGTAGSAGETNAAAQIDETADRIDNLAPRLSNGTSFDIVTPGQTALACTADSQCATGYCMDGFCCDTRCDNKCMACSAAKKGGGVDGVCGSIAYDTDPDNDCPYGACDGKNQCKNYNGVACTATSQCLSNYCVDGFCCNITCMGSCQACSAVKKGSGYDGACGSIKTGTDPDNECNPGECNGSGTCNSLPQPTSPNGSKCNSSTQCASGYCTDGVCCDSLCTSTCMACTAALKGSGSDGTCGPIPNDQDPDDECWGGACNGQGVCKEYNGVPCTGKTQCLSGYCVDGVCCNITCDSLCTACSAGKKGQGYDGVCGPIASGRDLENECNPGDCNGAGACNQTQTLQANGTVCVSGGQCATGFCVDGLCCDTACPGSCMACSAAKKGSGADGTCGFIGTETDPDNECNGGRCDGKGVCRFYNGAPCGGTGQCFSNYCVDGYCCNLNCNGPCQACSNAKKGTGYDGVCGNVAASTDPDNECNPGECNGSGSCNQTQTQFANGSACTFATQCTSGNCIDGVCCDSACVGTCVACTAAKKGQGANGTCGYIISNIDPDNECLNSDCNGLGACTIAANLALGASCSAGSQCSSGNCVDGVCCNSACAGICVACTAAKKGQGTDGTCGNIKYDNDPDEECYGGACTGAGACAYYNGVTCASSTQCLSTFCTDGVCCNNICGSTCYACTTAKKGSGYDGICSPIGTNKDPDNECNPGVCNGSGTCVVPTCTSSADCGTNGTCTNSVCVCANGFTGDGYTCTDINECQTNNGGCDVNATCANTPGSRTCTCIAGYSGDGVTCTDINECLTNNGGCDINATCTNTPGSRTCACNIGYSGDGITCTFTGQIVKIECGYATSCAQSNDNRFKCWGYNIAGELGIGDTSSRGDNANEMGKNLPFVDVGTGRYATQISMGGLHGCAVLDNGSLKCWGNNYYGQLGLGHVNTVGDQANEMGVNLPAIDLGTSKSAVKVAAAFDSFTCAVLNDGSVKCWGQSNYGQLGQGDTASRGDNAGEMGDNLPAINLGTGRTATAIAAGYDHVCALLDNGGVKCWGYSGHGECGYGDTTNRGDDPSEMGDSLPFVDLGTGKTAIAITAGQQHTCAILNDGSVKCWGYDPHGELGLGDTTNRGDNPGEMGDNLPVVQLGTGKTAIAIAGGYYHTCALLNDATVKCWGMNVDGQLGLGDGTSRGIASNQMGDNLPAVNLGTGKTAVAISVGDSHSCALLNDAKMKCWGFNFDGELGQGDKITRGNAGGMGDLLQPVQAF